MNVFRKKALREVMQNGDDSSLHHSLNKVLGVRDLTFFGIAAIIGAGSFTSMGEACYKGGPGVILLFIICAVACGFTAMCYAEFASRVPVSGSAYTYAYVSFGELFAWIIGWALLMEYSIGNIYVAFSWSGYCNSLLQGFGIHIPEWLAINYKEAHRAFNDHAAGTGTIAWQTAPEIGGLKIIFDLPAVLINAFITWLVYIGTKESRNATNAMVIIKLAILALVIIVGIFYVNIDNWTPFLPNGFGGVMAGASAVFFTYIGFDAVSTMAEECKNPQRDLPRGMIYSLAICTALYIILSLVIIGIASYKELHVNDPLAKVFELREIKWMLFIVSIAAVIAIASVLLVFQMGQPRIWMSMSRDGLLPKKFSHIHPKYKTPGFATIITGLVVGIPLFFTDKDFILDFTSIGTLFAFIIVCGGVLLLPPPANAEEKKTRFHLPYINGKYILSLLLLGIFLWLYFSSPDFFISVLNINSGNAANNLPMIVFLLLCIIMGIYTFFRNLSLIPVLGLLSCCYLLTGMAASNWIWFFLWMLVGLVIYFGYSYRKSKLNKKNNY